MPSLQYCCKYLIIRIGKLNFSEIVYMMFFTFLCAYLGILGFLQTNSAQE